MRNITHTAQHVAEICEAKNAAYGDSVARSAEALRLLYPHGLRPDQYLDAIFAARDFDKRSRLAQLTADSAEPSEELDAMVEDALLDITGYALLQLHHSERQHPEHQGKAPAPCASVNEDAANPSPATPASAERSAKQPTPPSSAATDASPSWPTPDACSGSISVSVSMRPASAPAPTAPTPAPARDAASAAGRQSLRRRVRTWAVWAFALSAGWLIGQYLQNVPASPIAVLLGFASAVVYLCSYMRNEPPRRTHFFDEFEPTAPAGPPPPPAPYPKRRDR